MATKRPKTAAARKAEAEKDRARLQEQLKKIKKPRTVSPTKKETPAVETPAVETPTVETPTVETPTVETPTVETPAVETPAATETTTVETPAATETTTEQPANFISLLSDLKETEQDQKEKTKIEQLANDFVDESHFDKITEDEDSPEIRKANAKVTANTIVTFVDVIFMLLACFIAKDFSDSKQAKFSLIPEKKKAIAGNIYQLLMLRKKKSNPVFALVASVLGAYIPMLVIAFMERRNRIAEEQKRIIEANAQAQAQANTLNNYQQQNNGAEKIKEEKPERPLNPHEYSTIKEQVIKTDKRGRHKKTCKALRGGKCNCK